MVLSQNIQHIHSRALFIQELNKMTLDNFLFTLFIAFFSQSKSTNNNFLLFYFFFRICIRVESFKLFLFSLLNYFLSSIFFYKNIYLVTTSIVLLANILKFFFFKFNTKSLKQQKIVNIFFADAEFCCNLRSPSDMVSNASFQGYPGRSHSRGPLIIKIQYAILSYSFL